MLVVKDEQEDKKEGEEETPCKDNSTSYFIKARLRGSGKAGEYNPGLLNLNVGDMCIVDTKRGLEFAVASMTKVKDTRKKNKGRLREVVRKVEEADLERLKKNEALENEAMTYCQERIRERELIMKLARVEYDFLGEKATFYFSSEGRVDFRDLVKDISYHLKVKVEMWQIGVRDEARISGGCGTCGKPLCCSTFLKNFEPVSIRMAKDQSLALNPMKISGTCGRLMCCLGYEHKTYCKMKKGLPRVGRTVTTPEGKGKITQINVLLEKISVRLEDGRYIVVKPCEIVKDTSPQPARPPRKDGARKDVDKRDGAKRDGAKKEYPKNEGSKKEGPVEGGRPENSGKSKLNKSADDLAEKKVPGKKGGGKKSHGRRKKSQRNRPNQPTGGDAPK